MNTLFDPGTKAFQVFFATFKSNSFLAVFVVGCFGELEPTWNKPAVVKKRDDTRQGDQKPGIFH